MRSTFALDLAKTKPLVGKVNDLFKKKYGIEMSENAARSFAAPFVFAEPLTGPGPRRRRPSVKALRETNIPGDQVIYPWKGIKFDPKTQQNIYATGTLVQIQKQHVRYCLAVRIRRLKFGMAVPGLGEVVGPARGRRIPSAGTVEKVGR